MADKTYEQLTEATDVEPGDLLASYRSPGPLKKLPVSTFTDYLEGEFLTLDGAAPMTGPLALAAGSAAQASLQIPAASAAPTGPTPGDLWNEADQLRFHAGAATKTIAFTNSALSGNTTGSAATLTTSRTISTTGDVTYTSDSFDGSSNVTGAAVLANVITAGSAGSVSAVPTLTWDAKGRLTTVGTAALGTAAAANTGTSGATVALLNGANTWSGAQTISGQASPLTITHTTTTTMRFQLSATTRLVFGAVGVANDVISGAAVNDGALRTQGGAFLVSTNSGGGAAFTVLAGNGGVQLNAGPKWLSGTGSPEGVSTASVGSLYSRTDGGAGTSFYVKESGSGNTGWVGK